MRPSTASPGGSFSCALTHSLDQRWNQFRKNLKSLRQSVSVDAVHDERTACRRLLSALSTVGPVVGRRYVEGLERDLKKVLRALGPLRDVHIGLERSMRFDHGSRIPQFRAYLHRQEGRLEKTAARRAAKVKAGRIKTSLRKIEMRLDRLGRALRMKSGRALRLLQGIDENFSAVQAERRALDPLDRSSLHRLRVAVKKFRYAVEALEPLLQGFQLRDLDQLHALQDHLGDVHDLEMISASFRDFMEERGSKRVPHLLPLQKSLLEQHNREMEKAIASADRILEHWRQWSTKGSTRLRTSGKVSSVIGKHSGIV